MTNEYIFDLGNGNGKAIVRIAKTSIHGEVEHASDEPREVEGYPMTATVRTSETPSGETGR